MRKLIVTVSILVLLLALITYPAEALETFTLVYDFPGQEQYGESGLTIAGESLYPLGNMITLGYGVEIPLHTIKTPDIFGFVPVFGSLKVAPFSDTFPLDVSLRAGYSFLTGDQAYVNNAKLDGGSYFAYGLGWYLKQDPAEQSYTKLEFLYSECNGTRTTGGVPEKLQYSRYSFLITFGYEGL
jgi:hypothetical protein